MDNWSVFVVYSLSWKYKSQCKSKEIKVIHTSIQLWKLTYQALSNNFETSFEVPSSYNQFRDSWSDEKILVFLMGKSVKATEVQLLERWIYRFIYKMREGILI